MSVDLGDIAVFVVRCPLGDQCSKKGGILAKKLDQESAKAALKHHLKQSPYHELSEEDATIFTDSTEVETYMEDASSWAKYQEDQADWYASRKRKAIGEGRPNPQAKQLAIGSRAAASSSSSTSAVSQSGTRTTAEATIQVNGVQLVACIDSLRRARTAAESAANLAAKASRAFNEEAAVIRQCEDVLRNYLP